MNEINLDAKTLDEVERRIKEAVRTLSEGSDWFSGMFDAMAVVRQMKGESR